MEKTRETGDRTREIAQSEQPLKNLDKKKSV
jgi:hypothetical protein